MWIQVVDHAVPLVNDRRPESPKFARVPAGIQDLPDQELFFQYQSYDRIGRIVSKTSHSYNVDCTIPLQTSTRLAIIITSTRRGGCLGGWCEQTDCASRSCRLLWWSGGVVTSVRNRLPTVGIVCIVLHRPLPPARRQSPTQHDGGPVHHQPRRW